MIASLVFAALLAVPKPLEAFAVGIVHVKEFGNRSGRAVVLVPGLACGPWVWSAQIKALSATYHIFTVSLPGFDGQRAVAGGDLMRRAVASIDVLIRERHFQKTVLVGHSLGGTLSVLFAETYPLDAANIVTVEGGYPEAPTQEQRDRLVARSIAPYVGLPSAKLAGALRQNMLQYTITRPADVDRATVLAGRSSPSAIVAWMKAALSLDLTPALHVIVAPITAIIPFDAQIDPYQGFKTAAAKLSAYRSWIQHAPHGEVVLIPNSRHFVMLDQPAAFEHALERAIAR